MRRRALSAILWAILLGALAHSAAAQTPARIGLVLMHGKGGSPGGHVAPLAAALETEGYLIANLEMPWSQSRSYDATVAEADAQVETALNELRAKGATRLFVAGHSQGGLFALHFGGKHIVDGIIAIAPGGNAAGPGQRQKLGPSVAQAHKLVADGKGNEKTRFLDFEGSKATYAIECTPANYLSWFDPDGAMNELTAVKSLSPQVPVLFIVPTGDYPPLQNAKQLFFGSLPANPLTRLAEPGASHLEAPAASAGDIERWIAEVLGSAGRAP